jgi:hypothetical protein
MPRLHLLHLLAKIHLLLLQQLQVLLLLHLDLQMLLKMFQGL